MLMISGSPIMAVEGRLVRVCEDNSNLVSFVALGAGEKVCENAVILIAGLTDGFMALAYTESLSRALLAANHSLVMVNLSSSWSQFGFRSLRTDCEDLEKHVDFLKARFGFRRIALLGHSTVMRHGKPEITCHVSAIILKGAVSDREAMMAGPGANQVLEMKKEAEQLKLENNGELILSRRLFGAPITANR